MIQTNWNLNSFHLCNQQIATEHLTVSYQIVVKHGSFDLTLFGYMIVVVQMLILNLYSISFICHIVVSVHDFTFDSFWRLIMAIPFLFQLNSIHKLVIWDANFNHSYTVRLTVSIIKKNNKKMNRFVWWIYVRNENVYVLLYQIWILLFLFSNYMPYSIKLIISNETTILILDLLDLNSVS